MRMVYFHVYVSISVLIYHSVDEGYHIEGIRHRVNKPWNSNKEQQSKAFHTHPWIGKHVTLDPKTMKNEGFKPLKYGL